MSDLSVQSSGQFRPSSPIVNDVVGSFCHERAVIHFYMMHTPGACFNVIRHNINLELQVP